VDTVLIMHSVSVKPVKITGVCKLFNVVRYAQIGLKVTNIAFT